MLSVLGRWFCRYSKMRVESLFCYEVLCVFSRLGEETELVAILLFSSRCHVTVLFLCLASSSRCVVLWSAVCECGISWSNSKTCVKRPLSKRPKIGFQGQLSLNAGNK